MRAHRWAAVFSVSGALALWAGGCEQQVGLGPGRALATSGAGAGPVVFDAICEDCGEACMLEGGGEGHCDEKLTCVVGGVLCPNAPGCAGVESCGQPCDECAGDPECEGEPAFCQPDGTCLGVQPECPSPACAGLVCGTPCDPCPPGDDTCPPPSELNVCDDFGVCRVATEVECNPCVASPPLQKKCGETCNPFCQPWDSLCKEPPGTWVCDASGSCGEPATLAACSPGYDPCGPDAVCGQPCSVCDPLDTANCAVTANLFCTGPNGVCTDQPMECPELGCGAGLPCGAQCRFCWPTDPDCQPQFCDEYEECRPAGEEFGACGGSDPCDGSNECQPCGLCDSSLPSCDGQNLFLVCNDGACSDSPFAPSCIAPCAGKACGEQCHDDCDPLTDPTCVPPVFKTCDATGACTENGGLCP